jgi:hypothetical protein
MARITFFHTYLPQYQHITYRNTHIIIINIYTNDRIMLPKFTTASQVHLSNKNKNIKGELLKYTPSIYFNKQCIRKTTVPKHAYKNISESSHAA